MPPQSCWFASSGNGLPMVFLTMALNSSQSFLRSSASRSRSSVTPLAFFIASMACSSFSRTDSPSFGMTPAAFSITTSAYIIMRRRYASYAKRSSPDSLISAGSVFALRPMFNTVSIMPGIERRAPDRTDISSGFLASPYFLPIAFSTFAMALSTSGMRLLGKLPLFR